MSLIPKIFKIKARRFLKEIKYAPVEKTIQLVVPKNHQAAWLRKYHQLQCSLHPKLQKQLISIRKAHPEARAVILFTPGLNWERQLFQRPQQLALALAKRGALVFYTQLDPYQGKGAIEPIGDRLYVCSLPLEQLSVLEHFYVYTLTWNRKYLIKFNRPRIIYDYVDNLAAFDGDIFMHTSDHCALLQTADFVLATSRLLFEEARKTRPDTLLVPNGVDFAHFHAVPASIPPPPDMAKVCSEAMPVIGYYGALAHWFDYDLMMELSARRVDLNFVLIGTKHDGSLDASGLLQRRNIFYLGAKPYAELPLYLAHMDVAILPFKVNPVTQATSPLKLFEYCAGGKPVVATPLMEVVQFPEILTGKNAVEFSQKIDEALVKRTDRSFIRRLEHIGRENTWENHAEQVLKAIESAGCA